jgi:hypothetical protein
MLVYEEGVECLNQSETDDLNAADVGRYVRRRYSYREADLDTSSYDEL